MIPRKVVSWLGISQFSSTALQQHIFGSSAAVVVFTLTVSLLQVVQIYFQWNVGAPFISSCSVCSAALSFLSPCSPINSHNRINMINNCEPSVANKSFFQPLSAVEPTKETREPCLSLFPRSVRNAEAESDVSRCPQLRGRRSSPQRPAQRPFPAAGHLTVSIGPLLICMWV